MLWFNHDGNGKPGISVPHSKNHSEQPLFDQRAFSPAKGSARIAGVYFIVGCLWILLTDRAVSAFTSDPELVSRINMFKGWFFVFTTALLVFGLIFRTLQRIRRMEDRLEMAYQDTVDSHARLEAAYEEIIATEDELRQQYDQLIEKERKLTESEEKLHRLAYYDSLTGQPNKLALYDHAPKCIAAASDCQAALLFLDLDNFKYINDTMGHGFGDRLIKRACERLLSIVEEDGVLYRFGGDEFIILVPYLKEADEAQRMASRILEGFKEAVDVEDSLVHISTSIGISLYPDHGSDVMELVKRADIAMYKAKEAGKGRCVVFDPPFNEIFIERMKIEKHLHTAMAGHEFELVYQPQVDLGLNRVTGLEALLRWRSPELGTVAPDKFIRIAESTHLIIPLGTWVLKNACAYLKHLHTQGYGHLTMSVNISMLQLLQTDFNELTRLILSTNGLQPEDLELEITETVLMESYDYVRDKLNALRAENVKIALDDFGTGYSSLSYLTHLPISTLKMDKSFVDSISTGAGQADMVGHIIQIGTKMNLSVVAEGVETGEQLDYLLGQGCTKIQGYYFSKPLPAQEMEHWLARWERERSLPYPGDEYHPSV